MIRRLIALAMAAAVSVGSLPSDAGAEIDLKVSVKWLRSSDGSVGPGDLSTQRTNGSFVPCDETVTEQDFLDRIAYANRILDRSGRGYRFDVEFSTVVPPLHPVGLTGCGDKGTPGAPNNAGTLSTCPVLSPGSVVISEIMVDPQAVRDEDGEWFEIQNTTATLFNMQNWTVRDTGQNVFTIDTLLLLQPFGRLVFGKRADYYANGNVNVDYAYGQSFFLNNTVADAIIIENPNAVEVDRVEYSPSWVTPGVSLSLKSTARDNNCQDAWGAESTTYWTEWTTAAVACRSALQVAAEAAPITWAWDADALNVYMGSVCAGGESGTTRMTHMTAAIGQHEVGGFLRPFHELGHSLGICHTHDCFDWSPLPCFCSAGTIGEDCLLDTPVDSEFWNNGEPPGALAETIAQTNHGTSYDALLCSQKQQVLDVLYNVMSYHRDDDWGYPGTEPALVCDSADIQEIPCTVLAANLPDLCRYRLSPDQLDRMASFANTMLRRARDLGRTGRFASGLTHFVDGNAPACPPWCSGVDATYECWPGNSEFPFATLTDALNGIAAENEPGLDHIILLRSGSYNEPTTIQTRAELRGSRGVVVIGK